MIFIMKQGCSIWIILLAVASIMTMDVSATSYRTKVVILGAGASGVAAASTLHKNGQDDFIIVEGQSFVGGKVIYTTIACLSVRIKEH